MFRIDSLHILLLVIKNDETRSEVDELEISFDYFFLVMAECSKFWIHFRWIAELNGSFHIFASESINPF